MSDQHEQNGPIVSAPDTLPQEGGQLRMPHGQGGGRALQRVGERVGGRFLGGMRVRKKVLFLHTLFWLGLALVLMVPLRPAITEVVEQAEIDQARMVLRLVQIDFAEGVEAGGGEPLWKQAAPNARVRAGTPEELGLSPSAAAQARAAGQPVAATISGMGAAAVTFVADDGPGGRYWAATVSIPESRRAVFQLYLLTAAALLAIYALVAAALELFVLPQHVYGPISRMLEADRAVQEGDKDHELIPESVIASDELGEIMRSRNNSIVALRRHEQALAVALAELERIASDLKRKNHLLEAARRNLADADRLASLGMMSAGIAHELNTPLAVLKGLVEKVNQDPESLDGPQAALMFRVVQRLERLGESLLDFARVRPAQTQPVELRKLVDEAATLVSLDRGRGVVSYVNEVPEDLIVECDQDRMLQVLVNLVRNAAEAALGEAAATTGSEEASGGGLRLEGGRVEIRASLSMREGQEWGSLTVTDNGPGVDPDLLSRVFEPFVSTRLDAHGTGLGLAVAEGIVREHGGLILARNREDGRGAVFEVMLPARGLGISDVAGSETQAPIGEDGE